MVNMRPQTLPPAKYNDKMGEDADENDPDKSTAARMSTCQEGKREKEKTDQTEGTPPLDSSESLSSDACYRCRYFLACKTQRFDF